MKNVFFINYDDGENILNYKNISDTDATCFIVSEIFDFEFDEYIKQGTKIRYATDDIFIYVKKIES